MINLVAQAYMRATVYLLTILTVCAISTHAFEPEPEKYYYLSNAWLQDNKVMTVDQSGKLYMADKVNGKSEQLWKFKNVGPSSYYIINAAQGDNKAIDSDTAKPNLRTKGNYSGQHWNFLPDGEWYRLYNNYLGKTKFVDTYNLPGNDLFLESSTRRTTGTFWKFTQSAVVPIVATTTTNVVTMSSNVDLNAGVTTATSTPTGSTDEVFVAGPGYYANSIMRKPCKAVRSNSILLSAPGVRLPHNDCSGRARITDSSDLRFYRTEQEEYEQVSKFFAQAEAVFLDQLKRNPKAVLNLKDEKLRATLKRTNGQLPMSYMAAFVEAELIASLATLRGDRTPEQQAAVDWLVRGAIAVEQMSWASAQKYYQRWHLDPCSFTPPAAFKARVAKRSKDKTRDLYANCGGEFNPLASAFNLTEKQQAHYDVDEFMEWGAYAVTAEMLSNNEKKFATEQMLAERYIAMGGVVAIGAGAGVAVGSIVATSGATIGASLFPFSTFMATTGAYSATAGAAVPTGGALGAGALAGPAIIVVGAIVGTAAAVEITMEDVRFNERMRDNRVRYKFHIADGFVTIDDDGIDIPAKKTIAQVAISFNFDDMVDIYSKRLTEKTEIDLYDKSAGAFVTGIAAMADPKLGGGYVQTDGAGTLVLAMQDSLTTSTRALPVTIPTYLFNY